MRNFWYVFFFQSTWLRVRKQTHIVYLKYELFRGEFCEYYILWISIINISFSLEKFLKELLDTILDLVLGVKNNFSTSRITGGTPGLI